MRFATRALAAALLCSAVPALGAEKLDPKTLDLPWMNSPAHDAHFRMADHAEAVVVFEAYAISCSWCNKNAPQVDALADEYKNDARVVVVDLGLDASDRDYRSWIATHKPNHPVVKDVDRKVWQALHSDDGIPQTFVVACDGSLQGSTLGYWGDEEKQALREAITRAKAINCR